MTDVPTQDIFSFVLARPVVEASGEHPHLVHLWWRLIDEAQATNRLVQVYIDGTLAAVSQDVLQRELWLVCDRSRAHRFELLAVPITDPDAIWRPRPDLLRSWDPPLRNVAEVALLRDERLAIDTQINVRLDGLQLNRGPLWPASEHRSGFGALFGLGEFGRDAITGPGLGVGELGMGPLGTDGTAWRWRRDDLLPGTHVVEISALDREGQPSALPMTIGGVEIEALPAPARTLRFAPDFTLTWSL